MFPKTVLKIPYHIASATTATIRPIFNIAIDISTFWAVIVMLYLMCVKDFLEIFIYVTTKLTLRVKWAFNAIGIFNTPREENQTVYRSASVQTEKVQTASLATSPIVVIETTKTITKFRMPLLSSSPISRTDQPTSPNQLHESTESSLAEGVLEDIKVCRPSKLPLPKSRLRRNVSRSRSLSPFKSQPAIGAENEFHDVSLHSPGISKRMKSFDCPVYTRSEFATHSREESFFRRKWNSFKLNRSHAKDVCLRMQPFFPTNVVTEKMTEVGRKLTRSNAIDAGSNSDHKMKLLKQESDDSDTNGCYKVMSRIKSKFKGEFSGPSVSYNKF